jgi:hypothetical protein
MLQNEEKTTKINNIDSIFSKSFLVKDLILAQQRKNRKWQKIIEDRKTRQFIKASEDIKHLPQIAKGFTDITTNQVTRILEKPKEFEQITVSPWSKPILGE